MEPTTASSDLADLYRREYRGLVRLAVLLVDDAGTAEEIVQDAFVRVHLARGRPAASEALLAYVRRAVVNGARSQLRRRRVRRLKLVPAGPSSADLPADHQEVLAAVQALPERQRACLVLRFWLDLSEADVAAALGVSAGSVKTHTHRGLAALRERLEDMR